MILNTYAEVEELIPISNLEVLRGLTAAHVKLGDRVSNDSPIGTGPD